MSDRSPAAELPRSQRPWLLAAVLAGAILLAVSACGGESPSASSQSTAPAATPAAVATPALAVTGVFIEPGDGRAPLLDEIVATRTSIDLEVYIITDEIILQALEDAQRRGVAVRVILEEHPFGGGGGQQAIFDRLQGAGIAVRWGNPVFRFTHLT